MICYEYVRSPQNSAWGYRRCLAIVSSPNLEDSIYPASTGSVFCWGCAFSFDVNICFSFLLCFCVCMHMCISVLHHCQSKKDLILLLKYDIHNIHTAKYTNLKCTAWWTFAKWTHPHNQYSDQETLPRALPNNWSLIFSKVTRVLNLEPKTYVFFCV